MRFQRFVLLLAAWMLGILCWQRSWLFAFAALLVCAWFVWDEDVSVTLDPDEAA